MLGGVVNVMTFVHHIENSLEDRSPGCEGVFCARLFCVIGTTHHASEFPLMMSIETKL